MIVEDYIESIIKPPTCYGRSRFWLMVGTRHHLDGLKKAKISFASTVRQHLRGSKKVKKPEEKLQKKDVCPKILVDQKDDSMPPNKAKKEIKKPEPRKTNAETPKETSETISRRKDAAQLQRSTINFPSGHCLFTIGYDKAFESKTRRPAYFISRLEVGQAQA
jgi:hypothetical protein